MAAGVEMLLQHKPGHLPYLLFLDPLYLMQRQRARLFASHPRDQLLKGLLGLSHFPPNVRRNCSCGNSSHGHPPLLWLHMTLALLCEPYWGVCSTTLLSQMTEITPESTRPKVATPIKLKPDFAPAYLERGIAYVFKGDKDRAFADFEKALELTNDPNIRQHAGRQLRELSVE